MRAVHSIHRSCKLSCTGFVRVEKKLGPLVFRLQGVSSGSLFAKISSEGLELLEIMEKTKSSLGREQNFKVRSGIFADRLFLDQLVGKEITDTGFHDSVAIDPLRTKATP
jgi:hypothetical protein